MTTFRTRGQDRIRQLISSDYEAAQRELHARPQGYGGKGKKWTPTVIALAKAFRAGSILDYGCGQGSLAIALRSAAEHGDRVMQFVRLEEYDPAVKGKEDHPGFCDLVVCTDVLEHIEPDRLDAVLAHIRGLARSAVLLVIALDPANKTLLDGRNAHLILESREWWLERLAPYFELQPWQPAWPLPLQFVTHPDKQSKRVIVVGVPRAC